MAGINIEKYHGGTEAKAVLRHCDKGKRAEDNHTNKQINKGLTSGNFQYGLKGYDKDYVSICSEYDRRIEEVDRKATKAPRKDRVTLVGLELPRPEGLPPERFREWSTDAIKTVMRFYGSKSFLAAYGHVDEVHDYMRFDESMQKAVKTVSREHVHMFFNPYSETGDSLNAKAFTSRENLIKLNRLVNDMSVEKYGVSFCNGSGKKSNKTMEQLKQESRALEQADVAHLQAENERLRADNERLQADNDRLRAELRLQAVKANRQADREIPDFGFGEDGHNGLSL